MHLGIPFPFRRANSAAVAAGRVISVHGAASLEHLGQYLKALVPLYRRSARPAPLVLGDYLEGVREFAPFEHRRGGR